MQWDDAMEYVEYEYGGHDYSLAASIDTGTSATTPVTAPIKEGLAEKIIYSVYADIETKNFDETIDTVNVLLEAHGAFVEHSSISGISTASRHYGWNEYRYASFQLRVPVENLNAITGRLGLLGNVTHQSSNADNITAQFFDTQSRVNSLRIQEERLLDMLSKADDVPDLIVIEERLGDVRYQIEWFQTMLNNWQRQVDYSSLNLQIREVEIFTEQPELYRSYWQQIGDGFMSTMRSVGRFFMNLFMWLIVSAPVLILLAVIAFIVLIIVKRKLKTMEKKRATQGIKPIPTYTPPPGAYMPPTTAYQPEQAPPEQAPPSETPPESNE